MVQTVHGCKSDSVVEHLTLPISHCCLSILGHSMGSHGQGSHQKEDKAAGPDSSLAHAAVGRAQQESSKPDAAHPLKTCPWMVRPARQLCLMGAWLENDMDYRHVHMW